MFFMTNKMEEDLTNMAYSEGYEQGYRRGYNAAELAIAVEALERANKALEGLEDENRRLEQVFKWAYELGSEDALARHGIVETDEIEEELEKK